MKVACSWSGGKDSSFACYKTIIQGFKVSYLINTVSQEYDRVLFHGIKSELARLQARLAQFPIVQPPINKDNYEEKYIKAAAKLKEDGIEGIVYGDIALQDSRDWNEKVCKKLEVKPIFPLWGLPREQILNEFIDAGFKAVVTCTEAKKLGKEWLGRSVDEEFIHALQEIPNVDLCGENGEYHTFVTGGPLFKGEIKMLETEKVLKRRKYRRKSYGHWFLEILRYEVA